MRLTFDFETTNIDYGDARIPENRIVCVAWKIDDGVVKYYYGDIMQARKFWAELGAADILCAYNAKFEQKWLLRLGIDIHAYTWEDPMLAELVLQGNRRPGFSLDAVAKAYGEDGKAGYCDMLMRAGVCPSDIPREVLLARCIRDVRTTYSLHCKQAIQIAAYGQFDLLDTRTDLTPILSQMEMGGMHLDAVRVYREYITHSSARAYLLAELDSLTGGINLRSGPQMAKFLYETLKFPEKKDARGKVIRNKPSKQFPDGAPLTDAGTLVWLATQAKTEQQRRFIELKREFSKIDAALTKNLEFFKAVCEQYDGKFSAQFNQTVAATHRLTSSGFPLEIDDLGKRGVQFQNMPRQFKGLFCAPSDDYYVVEIDSMQLEFRVAAFLGQDKQAMTDIENPDFDAHCTSASVMNEIPYEQFMAGYRAGDKGYAKMRREAKVDTFKPLYGGTKGTPAQEAWYQEFQKRYSKIYQTQESWLAQVAATGKLELPWGMTFHWDAAMNRRGLLIDKKTGRMVLPQVFNYPVQNLATAEIVPIALTHLARRCRLLDLKATLVNTIHDSVIAYVHRNDMDVFAAEAAQAFTTDVYRTLDEKHGLRFNVPLGCELVYGTHWGTGTTIIHDDVKHRGHETWRTKE